MSTQNDSQTKFDELFLADESKIRPEDLDLARSQLKNIFQAHLIDIKKAILESRRQYGLHLMGMVKHPEKANISSLLTSSVDIKDAEATLEALEQEYLGLFGEALVLR